RIAPGRLPTRVARKGVPDECSEGISHSGVSERKGRAGPARVITLILRLISADSPRPIGKNGITRAEAPEIRPHQCVQILRVDVSMGASNLVPGFLRRRRNAYA